MQPSRLIVLTYSRAVFALAAMPLTFSGSAPAGGDASHRGDPSRVDGHVGLETRGLKTYPVRVEGETIQVDPQ